MSEETKVERAKALSQRIIAWALQRRIVRAYLRYSEHNGSSLADSVTYRALFSVFAGVLLVFSLAALWLGGNPEAMSALGDALNSMIPGLSDIVDPERLAKPASFTIAGIISLLGLVGAAISAIASMRLAFHTLADELHQDGFFLWVILRNLLIAVIFGGLVMLAAALSVLSSIGLPTVAAWLGIEIDPGVLSTVTRIGGLVVVFAIDALAIVVLFKLLLRTRVSAKALWGGAALGAVGLIGLQELSGLFVNGATANALLATFASLIALLLWLNLSAQVILIAVSFIITAQREEEDRVRERFGATTMVQRRRRRAEELVHAATRELRAAQEAEREESGEPRGEGAPAQDPESR